MIEGMDIVRSAKKLEKTPFKHQGRLPMVGVDCIGLLVSVAKDLGIPHRDSTNYKRRPSMGSLRRGLEESGLTEIPVEKAGIGDVLAFWVRRRDRSQHVGILTDYGLIHTNATVGYVTEHVLSQNLKDHIDSAWRFPGVV